MSTHTVKALTQRGQDRRGRILEVFTDAVKATGFPPSLREIARAVGLSSPGDVHWYLNKLVDEGKLIRTGEPQSHRAYRLPTEEGACPACGRCLDTASPR